MSNQPQEQAMLIMALASLGKRLEGIEKRLDGKTPTLTTEEAVEGFKAYLKENSRPNTRRSFDYLLREFEKAFAGQNVPEIPPYRLQEFLGSKWGARKKTVVKQTLSKLKWFYSWCVKAVMVKGMSPFHNPCDLIEVKSDGPPERPEFVPVEKMREFLKTMKDERHYLITAILMTAGLRVSELIEDRRGDKPGLRKKDIKGRVLIINKPKSGKPSEIAVLPAYVAKELQEYTANMTDEDLVFPISYATVHGVLRTHARWVGLTLHPHDLRKWVATFWSRLHEYAMAAFVLRHSNIKTADTTLVTSLGARYIAPLSAEEVMAKQDKYMEGII